jgi:hypothetical protein
LTSTAFFSKSAYSLALRADRVAARREAAHLVAAVLGRGRALAERRGAALGSRHHARAGDGRAARVLDEALERERGRQAQLDVALDAALVDLDAARRAGREAAAPLGVARAAHDSSYSAVRRRPNSKRPRSSLLRRCERFSRPDQPAEQAAAALRGRLGRVEQHLRARATGSFVASSSTVPSIPPCGSSRSSSSSGASGTSRRRRIWTALAVEVELVSPGARPANS